MKRTLTLRGMQLLDHFKLAALIMAVLILIGLTFLGLGLLFGDNNYVDISVSQPSNGLLQFLTSTLSIWVMITFFTDGMSDFDTALRFGHKRHHYFISNFFIYALITLVDVILDGVGQGEFSLDWETISVNFFANFFMCFVIALFGFSVYKWGWKVLFALLGIPVITGFGLGILSLAMGNALNQFLSWLAGLPDYVHNSFAVLVLLGIIALYYWTIAKIEVK